VTLVLTRLGVSRRDCWLLVGGAALVALSMLLLICRPWDLETAFMIGAPVGRDFSNFWTAGHLAIEGRLDLLVDMAAYNDWLLAHVFHHDPKDWLVFAYPPHSLLFLTPLAALPYGVAVTLWTLGNLVLMACAVRLVSSERGLPWIACLSPAAFMMVAFGHFGGALAYLMTYVLMRAERRPVIAACCLALASVKPQLAVSLGLFLIFVGHWRVVLRALPVTAVLIGLSVLAFGLKPWLNFIEWTVPLHARMIANVSVNAFWMMSVYTAACIAGLPRWAAWVLQGGFSVAVMAGAVFLYLHKGRTPRTVALGLFAVVMALPYSAIYDLAIVTPALTVALFADQSGEDRPFLPFGAASALWIAPAFAIPLGLMGLPLVPVTIAGTLLWALVLQCRPPAERIDTPGVVRSEESRMLSTAAPRHPGS
jgi:alpha-1,2-mannosyltransferase